MLIGIFVFMQATPKVTDEEVGSLFPQASRSLETSHFTWGADLGSSIDLRGYDMSTFDLDVMLGYKNPWLRALGVGAGIHRTVRTGNTFIPIYGILRTSFRSKPSLFFFNLKAGYSFNTIHDAGATSGGFNFSAGLGINLAMSKKFQSHIVISYGFFHMTDAQQVALNMSLNHIDQVQMRFGLNF